jgi:intein/homing endonuclease
MYTKYDSIENSYREKFISFIRETDSVNDTWYISEKLHGCFKYNSLVLMADNTQKEISKINTGDKVKSYDPETNTFINKTVIKSIKRKLNKKWIKLRLNNLKEIICTEDHLFLTENGWIEAKNLNNQELVNY